ncbi:MAG: hypothetical protein CME62_08310 [Halobacteriovoraceae bacterium]|nr:hypothetical protein [Halobacteriovoraceae bacterium]|tara:strand:- start:10714 stop:11751 length:1038 start_codon:yes stop_codon:yes gene_type:complete
MLFTRVILLLFISLSGHAKLAELVTKQSVENIRFISSNGKYTYYQTRKGELKVSANYSIKNVFTGKPLDQFFLFGQEGQSKLIMLHRKNPHQTTKLAKNHDLYVTDVGTNEFRKFGEGHAPQLHMSGLLATYTDFETRELVVYNFATANERRIQLAPKHNPYFAPEAVMSNQNFIIYTDINIKGYSAVLLYDLLEKKFETLYKSQENGQQVSLCLNDATLTIGEFPLKDSSSASIITQIDIFDFKNAKKTKVLYTSPLSDIGQLICRKKELYFIKTMVMQEALNTKKTEVAKLNLDTGKLDILTELGDITQIFEFGSLLVSHYKGKYLIIDGEQKATDDSLGEGL